MSGMAAPLPVKSFALVLEDGTVIKHDVDSTDGEQTCFARVTTTPNVRPEHRAHGKFSHHFEMHFTHSSDSYQPEVGV